MIDSTCHIVTEEHTMQSTFTQHQANKSDNFSNAESLFPAEALLQN